MTIRGSVDQVGRGIEVGGSAVQRSGGYGLAWIVAACCGLWLASAPAFARESAPQTRNYRMLFQEEIYAYQVYVPPGYLEGREVGERPPGPVLLLFHGAGGNGPAFLSNWQELANEKGIVLIAPTLQYSGQFEQLMPTLARAFLADAAKNWKWDAHRQYFFGYSAGGVVGFDVAMMDSDVFAAAAMHASIIYPTYYWILDRAKRKIPLSLSIGDRDQYFALDKARRTRAVLEAAGFPVHYLEMPGHDHNYRAVAAAVNRDAWAYLSQFTLP